MGSSPELELLRALLLKGMHRILHSPVIEGKLKVVKFIGEAFATVCMHGNNQGHVLAFLYKQTGDQWEEYFSSSAEIQAQTSRISCTLKRVDQFLLPSHFLHYPLPHCSLSCSRIDLLVCKGPQNSIQKIHKICDQGFVRKWRTYLTKSWKVVSVQETNTDSQAVKSFLSKYEIEHILIMFPRMS